MLLCSIRFLCKIVQVLISNICGLARDTSFVIFTSEFNSIGIIMKVLDTMSHHSEDGLLIVSSDSFWEPGNYKR